MTEWLPFHFSLSCIGEGNGNPLQCSCLENPRDGRAWWASVYGVAQSRTRLKRLSSSSSNIILLLYYNGKYIIIHLSKPIECKPPRVNLNVNYGLWRIMMCQDRVTDCNKCTWWGWGTLRILIVKETGMGVVCRQGVYGNCTFRSVLLGT